MVLTMALKEELKTFTHTTSIKGVSRCAKSHTSSLRCLWGVCIVVGSAMTVYQLYILLNSYFSYPTSTKSEVYSTDTIFPDITICRINPMPFESAQGTPTPNHYKRLISSFEPLTTTTEDDWQTEAVTLLQSTRSHRETYKDVFMNSNASGLLPNCSFFTERLVGEDCGNYLSESSLSPLRTGCSTFRLNETALRFNVTKLVFVAFLNDLVPTVHTAFSPVDPIGITQSGIEVYVHAPNTIPNLQSYISVAPGTMATITLTEERRKKLPTPYSDCASPTPDATISDYVRWDFNYDNCKDQCVQNALLEECGCIDGNTPARSEMMEENEYCTSLSYAFRRFASKIGFNMTENQLTTLLNGIEVIEIESTSEGAIPLTSTTQTMDSPSVTNSSTTTRGVNIELSAVENVNTQGVGKTTTSSTRVDHNGHLTTTTWSSVGKTTTLATTVDQNGHLTTTSSSEMPANGTPISGPRTKSTRNRDKRAAKKKKEKHYKDEDEVPAPTQLIRNCSSFDDELKSFCLAIKNVAVLRAAWGSLTCVVDGSATIIHKCKSSCKIPCLQFAYSHSVSMTSWPHVSSHLAFYTDVIQHQDYASHFDIYNMYADNFKTRRFQTFDELRAETLILDNFLKVVVQFDGSHVRHLTETPLQGAVAIVGSLGGILNLWIGISFVTCVELAELLWKLLCAEKKAEQVERMSTKKEQEHVKASEDQEIKYTRTGTKPAW